MLPCRACGAVSSAFRGSSIWTAVTATSARLAPSAWVATKSSPSLASGVILVRSGVGVLALKGGGERSACVGFVGWSVPVWVGCVGERSLCVDFVGWDQCPQLRDHFSMSLLFTQSGTQSHPLLPHPFPSFSAHVTSRADSGTLPIFHQCVAQGACCPDGGCTVGEECTVNRAGPLCGHCIEDHYLWDGNCIYCHRTSIWPMYVCPFFLSLCVRSLV